MLPVRWFDIQLANRGERLQEGNFSSLLSLEKTNAGRDWGQEEKGMTEDEMAGWHHRLDGHKFE